MQSLPLEAKIIKSQQRIKEWYEYWNGNVYVSVSGKDSMVVHDLVKNLYPDVPAVFCNTGIEWPEIVKHIKTLDNVEIIKPRIRFKEVIERFGYPVISKEQSAYIYDYRNTKSEKLKHKRWYGDDKKRFKISEKWKFLVDAPFPISDKCCDVMKKEPFEKYEKRTGRKPFFGIMANDSSQRRGQFLKHGGCNNTSLKRPRSNPIGFWLEKDVLMYLKEFNVPYAKEIYGEIVKPYKVWCMEKEQNTGCYPCLFGIHMHFEPNKFQRMKESHPKLWNYCINKLEIGKVLDYIGVNYK